MRIAIIEQGHRQYLLDTFAQHPEFEAEISCFAEWKPKTQTDDSIPVISVSELKNGQYDTILIAVSHNHHLSRLLTYLHSEKLENIYAIRLYALDTNADFIVDKAFNPACVDKIPEQNEKPYLVHLETHVCDHCNLNCKACNNFSPFVKGRQVADLEHFERDMRYLAELFSTIGRLFLLGGEPLLEPEHSCKMAEISRRYFPNAELRLLTNAILIPKMTPEFWKCMRKYQVIIHISVYPPVLEKLPAIEMILHKHEISYLLAKKVETFARHWTLYPFEDAEFNNNRCGSAGCHYLRDGMIAKCPDTVLIENMTQGQDYAPDKTTANISEVENGWELIQRLNAPCDLCKKCSVQRMVRLPWEAAGKSPSSSDWLLENRLEYENRQMQTQLQRLNDQQQDTAGKLKQAYGQCDKLQQENGQLQIQLQRLNEQQQDTAGKLKQVRCQWDKLKQENSRLQTRLQCLSDQQRDTARKFKQVCGEYAKSKAEIHNIQVSLSFRLGRAMTWLPRKVRSGIRDLKERG